MRFSNSANEVNNISYRQAGISRGGDVKRGGVAGATMNKIVKERVPSSIPSKYETILNPEIHEAKAFGSQAYRFEDSDDEIPGPGSYYKEKSFIKSSQDSGSISRLGYGEGFVSKTKRFGDETFEVIPGPGHYNYNSWNQDKKSFNQTGTSSFAAPNIIQRRGEATETPGPGYYNSSKSLSRAKGLPAKAAFLSTSSKGIQVSTSSPAPGQYDSSFLTALQKPKQTKTPFNCSTGRLSKKLSDVPGPGSYAIENAEKQLKYDMIAQARSSSMFRASIKDRFGPSSEDLIPGPGAYVNDSMVKQEISAGSSSAFKSKVPRISSNYQMKAKPPGPAFYNPQKPSRKSYMLNATRKWV